MQPISNDSPPINELKTLVNLYQNKNLSEAESLARKLIENFPSHQLAWKMLGSLLCSSGTDEALDIIQKAVEINPKDFESYNPKL